MKEFFKRPLKKGKSKYFDGVCSGIADFIGIDPFWIRLIFVLCAFETFGMVIIYLILSILMDDSE